MELSFGQPLGSIVQYAYVVQSIDRAAADYVDRLGIGPWFAPRAVHAVRGALPRPAHIGGHQSRARVLGSRDARARRAARRHAVGLHPSSGQRRYGFHHWAVFTEQLDAEHRALPGARLRGGLLRRPASGSRISYVDSTRDLPGMIELVEHTDAQEQVYETIYRASVGWGGDEPLRRSEIDDRRDGERPGGLGRPRSYADARARLRDGPRGAAELGHVFGPLYWDERERVDDAIAKLTRVREAGIRTIVDPTAPGLGRYVPRVREVAQAAGLQVIVASGVYAFLELPGFLAYRPTSAIASLFVREITEGIDDTGVKAAFLKCAVERHGVIGDVPRILEAVAIAATETGVPVMVHTNAAAADRLDGAREAHQPRRRSRDGSSSPTPATATTSTTCARSQARAPGSAATGSGSSTSTRSKIGSAR